MITITIFIFFFIAELFLPVTCLADEKLNAYKFF